MANHRRDRERHRQVALIERRETVCARPVQAHQMVDVIHFSLILITATLSMKAADPSFEAPILSAESHGATG